MGFKIPILNVDHEEFAKTVSERIKQPGMQKALVLVIVSIALLLDNMLYMVIVPIVPEYFRDTGVYPKEDVFDENGNILLDKDGDKVVNYIGEDEWNGWLFASKAMVQIVIGPLAGTVIDRIGYEMPMVFGLSIMFLSTLAFAFGSGYWQLFMARSLQGLGSAFADTSGLAMIADRFQDEKERSKALGIAIAFISFGSLVAPPYGGYLYQKTGKIVPFVLLSLVCLADAFMIFAVIHPRPERTDKTGEPLKGTPIHKLFLDPYIAVCSGALIVANISLAFLEPTISNWMNDTMSVNQLEVGMVWLPAFFPHVAGVYLTVLLMQRFPQYPWVFAGLGLLLEGCACFVVPYSTHYWGLIVPLSVVCFGVALIDTSILPMLGYLVDTRHVSVYGSVYAIADISYSLAYALGPVIAGQIVADDKDGFFYLNMVICGSNLLYAPMLTLLRKVYIYKPFAEENPDEYEGIDGAAAEQQSITSVKNETYRGGYGAMADDSIRSQAMQGYGDAPDEKQEFGIPAHLAR